MIIEADRGFDIIGDIHGCADELVKLLDLLGYKRQNGIWQHSKRMAIFVGDLIDRGPKIREVLHLVHEMVVKQAAICLMGNHEFAALAWYVIDHEGNYVREHSQRNEQLIEQTLQQFAAYPNDWHDFRQWFYQLPLILDAERFRVVHACWHQQTIANLRYQYPNCTIDDTFIVNTKYKDEVAFDALKYLLTGPCMPLPNGMTMTDSLGYTRNMFRSKFWQQNPKTFGDIVFQPDYLPAELAQTPLTEAEYQRLHYYAAHEPLLFIGHYWMKGEPAAITNNIACVDYSAVRQGKLVAYRLDDEKNLDNRKFVWVDCK